MSEQRVFLSAAWRYLLVANYTVDRALLEPLVPAGTELDLWNGESIASIVGFRFVETRVLGMPIPWHVNFDEVNLRIYVRRKADDGTWRRGVVFVREIVPRLAIALVARWAYNEPYVARRMRHDVAIDAGRVGYGWREGGAWQSLDSTVAGEPSLPAAGSEAEFTIEHYWGYTRQRDGGTKEYEVTHPPWRVWPASSVSVEVDAARAYGAEWVEALAGPPRMALVAEGSAITVGAGRRISRG